MNTFRRRCAPFLTALVMLTLAASVHAAPDLITREICKDAIPQVASAYAGILQPAGDASYCIVGDFTGDGRPDVLMVVKVLVAKVPASTGIQTIYPFSTKDHRGSADKGRLQFLALHATPASKMQPWTTADKLLLDGQSPILVLRDTEGASDLVRVTQRSRELKELQLSPRAMRNEGVMLGTEAVTAILYWNGKTYVLHEDPAGP